MNNVFLKVNKPENLDSLIYTKIGEERKRKAKVHLMYTSFVSVISLGALVPALTYLFHGFSQSGFYEYFSLLISDGGTALSSWKEILLSLVESLPVLEVSAFLALVLVLLATTKYIVRDTRTIYQLA
ncbi:MAG: hypothetical protein WCK48_01530 [bacterium]